MTSRRCCAVHGFTLIEMLVVMAIVALLLTIASPKYFGSIERSKETVLRENLKMLRDGIDKFYSDQGHYPEKLDELVEKRYFRSLPVDPITDSSDTWVGIPSQEAGVRGLYDVTSGASGRAKDGVPYANF